MTKVPIAWDSDGTWLYKLGPDRYVIERPGELPFMLGRADAAAWAHAKWPDRWLLEFDDDPDESPDIGWSEVGQVIPMN